MATETRTAYPADAAPEIADALNATGEVRARLVGDTTIEVSRELSRGWQDMGRIELEVDYDDDDNEFIAVGEFPQRRRAWIARIVDPIIERHNA
jgi:hypothetical protein